MKRTVLAHPKKLWRINTDFDATEGHGYGTKVSAHNHCVSVAKAQNDVINPTNPRRAFHDRIEHRLHVGWRPADDTEHLGGCGLMLQGLAQLRVAFLKFLKQTHVFDSDHGLVSERLEKGN